MCADMDDDADGMNDSIDVDDDNDGLIEINFLEDLDAVRHDLQGFGTHNDGTSTTHIGNTGRANERAAYLRG